MSQWGNKDYANNVPKYLDSNHPGNTNVYLVNASRIANAASVAGKSVSHQGWVKVKQGTGYIQTITVSGVNTSLTYANAYLNFAGSNTSPANGQVVVSGTNNVTIVINTGGAGFASTPTVTSLGNNANNANLVFNVVMGGRAGRIQTETLVALSEPVVTDKDSGSPYFSGL